MAYAERPENMITENRYDEELTKKLTDFCREEAGIDLFGIADVDLLNAKARPGRRPVDLYPSARAVMVIGVGLLDHFARGWVRKGNSGKFYSLALLEIERRCWLVRRFLRQKGFRCFAGETYGGGLMNTGICFTRTAESCGVGYVGKNNTLITEKYGPRINMTCMATDASLKPDIVKVESRCGKCRACQNACMSGAVLGDGFFHQRQCESIINCQPNKRFYSDHVGQDCDNCLAVCPQGEYKWRKRK